jgi:surface antigen
MITRIVTAVILAALISACTLPDRPQTASNACDGYKRWVGAAASAGAGALVGNQFGRGVGKEVATGLGALLGMIGGYHIGKALDEADCRKAQDARASAFDGKPGLQNWSNPDSGYLGQAQIIRQGTESRTGGRCREVMEIIQAPGGELFGNRVVACQTPDGEWSLR